MLALDQTLLVGGLIWPPALWLVPAMALGVAVVSALLPAWGAYRVGVLELLQ
jgi:putative ABC transport system permease protein